MERAALVGVLLASAACGAAPAPPGHVTFTVSAEDQQAVTEWGAATLQNYSPYLQHDLDRVAAQQALLVDLGLSIWRLPVNCAVGRDDGTVDPAIMGELADNVAMHAGRGLPRYLLSIWSAPVGLKTRPFNGSVLDGEHVSLREDAEGAFVAYVVAILDFLRERGLPRPVALSIANEPTNEATYDQMWWEPAQYARVARAARAALDAAGHGAVQLVGPEMGRAADTAAFLGGPGLPDLGDGGATGGALGILATHSYDWGADLSTALLRSGWVDGALASGRERWMTEYSYYQGGTQEEILLATARRLAADLAFLRMNGWFWWSGWGGHGDLDQGENLLGGDGVTSVTRGKVYGLLQKVFRAAPVGSRVRRVAADAPDFVGQDAVRMDLVALAGPGHLLVLVVNPGAQAWTAELQGLTGATAHVFRHDAATEMAEVATLPVAGGAAGGVPLAPRSVTLVVTD